MMSPALAANLSRHVHLAIAVSGGVDSMTLAAFAHQLRRSEGMGSVEMIHAVSPAVPPAATERVRARAEREGWRLTVTGYLANSTTGAIGTIRSIAAISARPISTVASAPSQRAPSRRAPISTISAITGRAFWRHRSGRWCTPTSKPAWTSRQFVRSLGGSVSPRSPNCRPSLASPAASKPGSRSIRPILPLLI